VFSSIWTLESEVNNGGFAQYFGSCEAAEAVASVVVALEMIRAANATDIVSALSASRFR